MSRQPADHSSTNRAQAQSSAQLRVEAMFQCPRKRGAIHEQIFSLCTTCDISGRIGSPASHQSTAANPNGTAHAGYHWPRSVTPAISLARSPCPLGYLGIVEPQQNAFRRRPVGAALRRAFDGFDARGRAMYLAASLALRTQHRWSRLPRIGETGRKLHETLPLISGGALFHGPIANDCPPEDGARRRAEPPTVSRAPMTQAPRTAIGS